MKSQFCPGRRKTWPCGERDRRGEKELFLKRSCVCEKLSSRGRHKKEREITQLKGAALGKPDKLIIGE